MDIQPWMGQVGIASAAILLFLLIGRSYVATVAGRVSEVKDAHRAELDRLEKSWEARLTDMRTRAEAWEATANRREATVNEALGHVAKLLPLAETTVALVRAIREGQTKP